MSQAEPGDNTVAPGDQALVPLLAVKEGVVFANSRDIAAAFRKQHKHVLHAIDKLIAIEPELHGPVFRPMQIRVSTSNGGFRDDRAFDMTRDGFALLAMGFTGEKAFRFKLAWIDAFNRMEAELRLLPPPKTITVRSHRRAIPHRAEPLTHPAADNQAVMRIAGETLLVDLARLEFGPEERVVCFDGVGQFSVEPVRMDPIRPNGRFGHVRAGRPARYGVENRGVWVVGVVIGTLPNAVAADDPKPKQIGTTARHARRFEPGSDCAKDLLQLVRSARKRMAGRRSLDLGQALAETLEDIIAREADPKAAVRGPMLDWDQGRATEDLHRKLRAEGKDPGAVRAREVLH